MRWLSISAVALLLASPARAAPRVILFGAHWCAPCMAEAAELPALAAALAPARLTVAWVDRPFRPARPLPTDIASLPPDEARRLAERIAGEGFGLPFAAVLDGGGQVCAIWRAPLQVADAAGLLARCGR